MQRGPRNCAPGLGFLRSPAAPPQREKRCACCRKNAAGFRYGGRIKTQKRARTTRQVYGLAPGPKNACGPDKGGGHHGRGLAGFDTGRKTEVHENNITARNKKPGQVAGFTGPGGQGFTRARAPTYHRPGFRAPRVRTSTGSSGRMQSRRLPRPK